MLNLMPVESLPAPNFYVGAPRKKKLGALVQKLSREH